MNADWRAELRGLHTEEYIKTCTHITAIDYGGYLTFTSKDDGFVKRQAHCDWKDTIDRLLQCKHQGLLRKGKELQQKWSNNAYKHLDDMHWALQKRKRSAKLQSVTVTGLADASVNDTMKRMLQEELDFGGVPSLTQPDSSEDIRAGCESQGVPSTSETNLHEVFSNLVRPIDGEVESQRGTARDTLETEDQNAIVDNQDRDDLLASVMRSRHNVCEWIVEEKCMSCLFQEYQEMSIEALFAKEIKKVDVADAIATFGVFAPYAPTDRMRSVFGESRLENVAPIVRLQVEEEYDLCVLKAIRLRMNNQRDEAFEALEGIKDRKIRVMFATLIEHLPLDKESRIAEETFVATYIAPILLGTLRTNEKVSIHFPNAVCVTQKDQGMHPDRPDIIAKIGGRELLLGEVTGPCQETYRAKNAWDLYRLARFGKSLLGDNPFAPLIQIVHTKGTYMRLTIKARGMFLLERVGAFVIPTSVDMLPSLLGTIQTLSAAKDDLAILLEHKPGSRKRSWDFPDLPITKKLLV
ncbi:hypothetical protein BG011_001637 [Mortierella polycephala]|uniref:Uncharacterized protein n=1 Tax=Mortierella polycephala TaxID=41804 RepID=A0A9P6PK03_9FUNG|nr:hypothetical protein BG011_001637 [Mortierella polycephala]